MNVTKTSLEDAQVVLEIETEAAVLDKAIKKAVRELANMVNIPGFRKGKVPRKVLERHVGAKAILDTAFEGLVPEIAKEAMEQEDIEPVTQPQAEAVTLAEGQPLVFKLTFTPRPEVTLGEYKGLKIAKKAINVSDEEVDAELKRMQRRRSKLHAADDDATVEDGDMITLDFKGEIDGTPFDGGEGEDFPLDIGSGSFVEGFESQLIGAKVGEDRDVNVTFPDDYHEKAVAGKNAVFHTTVRSIKKRELPELNDEFAKEASKFATLDELKADIKRILTATAESQAVNERRVAAVEQATNNITVDIPEVMIENRINQMIEEMSLSLQQQGLNFEQYMQYANTDIAKVREDYREQAEKDVRMNLMLDEVAKAENLKAENEDISREIVTMAAQYRTTPQEVQKVIREQGRASNLVGNIVRRKAVDVIYDNLIE